MELNNPTARVGFLPTFETSATALCGNTVYWYEYILHLKDHLDSNLLEQVH